MQRKRRPYSGPTFTRKGSGFPSPCKIFQKYVVVKPFYVKPFAKTGLLKVNQSMRFQSHAWGNWQTGRVPLGVGYMIHYTGKEENILKTL